jgi:hypothetical protein
MRPIQFSFWRSRLNINTGISQYCAEKFTIEGAEWALYDAAV